MSTVEVLTEVVAPAAATPDEVARFAKVAEHQGVQTIPYSACFFKGTLHVYAYYGPVRGFDLSVAADSVRDVEAKLDVRLRDVWADIPPGVVQAQRELPCGPEEGPL